MASNHIHTSENVQGAVTKTPWSGQLLIREPVAVAALFICVLKLMMPHNIILLELDAEIVP